jgi:hypothetical protein
LQLLDGLYYGGTFGRYSGNATYVGIWADANAANIGEWAFVPPLAPPSPGVQWVSGSATCKNVVTGLRLSVLTALVGAVNHPQRKVLQVYKLLTPSRPPPEPLLNPS